ncbi:MAG: DNA transposition protein, partial [Aliarcobacter sp.]|nr:DNA transposition protein [Aliarcobacter sp.]
MDFTEKKLAELLNIAQQAVSKALKNIHFELKVVEGSTKPVKHYLYNDLPQRYKDKLVELGVVKEDKKDDSKLTNISKANFTNVYLMAGPIKQEIALARCKLIKFYLM